VLCPKFPQVLNPYNGACSLRDEGVCIHQLVSLEPVAHRVTAHAPDLSFTLRFGFHTVSVEDLSHHREYETYFGECRLTSGVSLKYPGTESVNSGLWLRFARMVLIPLIHFYAL
jgi:hypothetical protein